ncbi:MAG: FAD-dependent oxidoreductase [Cyclobacteriaceae bacterium]
MKKVDYIIVGQGIAGSVLALQMLDSGKSVIVIDNAEKNTSTEKAAGLYNPITGRKMVKTWMADELFDGLEEFYKTLEERLGSHFLFPMTIYRPFYSHEEANDWQGKLSDDEYKPFIEKVVSRPSGITGAIDQYGGIYLKKCGYVDLPEFRNAARKYFEGRGVYQQEDFQYSKLEIIEDNVCYDNVVSQAIIFCEGPRAQNNPFWKDLPFRLVKGEIIKVEADLPNDLILNRGVFVVPKKDGFNIGSTYDHHNLNYESSEKGISELKQRFSKLFDADYTVKSAVAGVRPATYDRRPFLGTKMAGKIGIFNGFGTKGVSLVPFFAHQYINYLEQKSELIAEVNVNRVI